MCLLDLFRGVEGDWGTVEIVYVFLGGCVVGLEWSQGWKGSPRIFRELLKKENVFWKWGVGLCGIRSPRLV